MKRRTFLLAGAGLLSASVARSDEDLSRYFPGYEAAFVLLDGERNTYLRHNPERCRRRFTPCSTFKIVNSLIGLETGVIPSPEYRLKWDGKKRPIDAWNQDHTLRTAFSNSVLWYYVELARRVGLPRLREYVERVGYGNQDVSGGFHPFWLESSLRISAEEQVRMLGRLHRLELPFSLRTQLQVLELMKAAETGRGILRGKTGTAGDAARDIATLGWYVGSVTCLGKTHLFAMNLSGGVNPSGRTAREITRTILRDRGLL